MAAEEGLLRYRRGVAPGALDNGGTVNTQLYSAEAPLAKSVGGLFLGTNYFSIKYVQAGV